jgi:hypothetical protein
MKHRIIAALVLVLALAACADSPTATDTSLTPAFATWEEKINGGADLYVSTSCATLISTSLSATDWGAGEYSGQVQIKAVAGTGTVPNCAPAYPEVLRYEFHGTVTWFDTDEANTVAEVCGVISAHQGQGTLETGSFDEGNAFMLGISNASPDRLRVLVGSTAATQCANGVLNTAFGATAYTGDLKIR